MPGPAVTVVPSGGLAVRSVEGGAPPMTVVESGGIAVTVSDQGAPFVLENYDGGDDTPNPFTFTDVSDAALSTLYESNEIEVTGISPGLSLPVAVAGSTYTKKPSGGSYGAYTSSAGVASLGDKFKVHHTSSASYETATNTTLTIGGVSDTFTTTTLAYVPTATAYIGAIIGDSRGCGVNLAERGTLDLVTLPTDVYQVKANNTISQALPLDHTVAGDDAVGLGENYAVQRHTDTGLPYYIIPRAIGGSAAHSTDPAWDDEFMTSAVASINAGIALVQTATPGAVFNEVIISLGTNDYYSAATFATAIETIESRLRTEIYKNGVSGATVGSDLHVLYLGMRAEHRQTSPQFKNGQEAVLREHGARPGNKYLEVPRNPAHDNLDGLHENNAGVRWAGTAMAALWTDTTPATVTLPSSHTIYADQKLGLIPEFDKYAYIKISDPAFDYYYKWWNVTSGQGSDEMVPQIRGAANATIPVGTYNLTVTAITGAGVTSTFPLTITSVAAYGTQVETLARSWTIGQGLTIIAEPSTVTFEDMPLKRGVNIFSVLGVAGSVTDWTTAVCSNGLVGVRDANSGFGAQFYIYSAQDETVDINVTHEGSSPSAFGYILNLKGTEALPTASATTTSATTAVTVPANGIGIVNGYATGGLAPPSGQTNFADPPIKNDGAMYAGYRTTSGDLGAQGGFARLFASTWAKAA